MTNDRLVVRYTKSPKSVISWAIRYAIPRSRFSLSPVSHCIIINGGYAYSADLFTGVTKKPIEEAMKGRVEVLTVEYTIPFVESAHEWLDAQVGKKYDLKGALGLGLSPNRDWEEDDSWFCYELTAAALKAGGRDDFQHISHITDIALLAIKP